MLQSSFPQIQARPCHPDTIVVWKGWARVVRAQPAREPH